MSIQTQFEQLYENIKLTPSQREDAKKKYNGVCKKLHDYYYPTIEYTGDTKLLIGSYGKHTNIRPPRDVDVLFIMPDDKFQQYDDNESNGQSQLLQDIRNILSRKYTTTEKIRGWGKVVLIQFSDGTHNVELLPAWEQGDGKFTIPNTERGGYWEIWDPRSEIEKINESDDRTEGKTRALIRMVKKWSENCSVELKSSQIENKGLHFFDTYSHEDKDYSIFVRDFFGHFSNCADEDSESYLETAHNRAIKACDFESEGEMDKATEEWKKIFGDDFPATLAKSTALIASAADKIRSLEKLYSSAKEEFLDLTYGIKFAVNPIYQIRIDAHVTQDGFRPAWLSSFLQKRYPLKKKKKLTFSIVKNNVPSPYSIMWKVRNFGDEAKIADDLRGEITHDKGFAKKEENTKYYGEHYVECYIIKNNNMCVAIDRIMVPIDRD